ncbi:MAG: hypothetical protein CM1200mP39_09160 [Dehalococcoidia bacterium]|nr:MAG: hypothetical protein CM1200mP39_09160 [Dehalococcoidia bacterium]
MNPDYIKEAVNRGITKPTTRLLAIENTHNASSGRALDAEQMKAMAMLVTRKV